MENGEWRMENGEWIMRGESAIALKEANETDYWIELLHQSQLLEKQGFDSMKSDIVELLKLLTSIIKSSKKNPLENNRTQ